MTGAAALRSLAGTDDSSGLEAVAGRRFFDPASATWTVNVFPGEFYVTKRTDEVLVTLLGSCVAACIRDPVAGVGGMNHFMLSHHSLGHGGLDERSARFGNFAMEKLINEMIKAGCARERLEIKVFGGGNVTESSKSVGTDNAEFVLRYLNAEDLGCAAQDLGGTLPRRIHYYPNTGRVVRRLLGTGERDDIGRNESAYASRLERQRPAGDIQLFGSGE